MTNRPLFAHIHGGGSRFGLVRPICPFLSLLGLPVFLGDFPDLSFSSFSASTYIIVIDLLMGQEHSRNCPQQNQNVSWKKWETPRFGNPRLSFSQVGKLAMGSNELSGTLARVESPLSVLTLHENKLTGSFPTFCHPAGLEVVLCSGNMLEGTFPHQVTGITCYRPWNPH